MGGQNNFEKTMPFFFLNFCTLSRLIPSLISSFSLYFLIAEIENDYVCLNVIFLVLFGKSLLF